MTDIIDIGLIHIPERKDRQRSKMNPQALDDLQKSITKTGLINAIAVELHRGPDGNRIELIAGERRLTVIGRLIEHYRHGTTMIPPGRVPVVYWDELSAEERMEIELDENIHREDLPWADRVKAVAALHALRTKQAGGEAPTQATTASEVFNIPVEEVTSNQRAEVSRAIILAKHMDTNPALAGAKTEKEAFNLLRKDTINLFLRALDEATENDEISSRHTCHFGDFELVSSTIPDGTFDACVTDPPYGVGAHTWTPQSGSDSGVQHNYDDDPRVVDPFIKFLFRELYRITKTQAHVFACCDIRRWNEWSQWAAAAGFDPWYTPIIWDKGGVGNIVGNVDGPRKTYEAILFLRKGGKPINQLFPDVIKGISPGEKLLHAAQKPVDLFAYLLKQICMPGDKVIDPCVGSGTIFPACNELRLIATGYEKVEENYLVAKSRLSEGEQLNGQLPGL